MGFIQEMDGARIHSLLLCWLVVPHLVHESTQELEEMFNKGHQTELVSVSITLKLPA